MDATRFELNAREVLHLLDRQVAAIVGRRFVDFTQVEASTYKTRKRRILKLRSALSKFVTPV
jgi:hypothetical protein